jgi:hypothetical protein
MAEHALPREFSWRGPEFLYKKKTPLWYANISVFFFVVFLGLLWLNNIPGMAVLAFALWLFLTKANERPRTVDYKIDPLGIHIEDHTFHYEGFESFSVEVIGTNAVVSLDPAEWLTFPTNLIVKHHDLEEIVTLLTDHLPERTNYSLIHKITHRLHY